MPPQQTSLLSPTELAYLHSSLSFSPPLRPDARSPTTFRPLVAELDLLPSANGSARLCFADGTEGIVGIKAELERSTPNGQGEVSSQIDALEGVEAAAHAAAPARRHTKHGWVEVTIDMPGPRDDDSNVVFLAQMIHEGLVADGALHWRLLINQRWHWKLYIDVGSHAWGFMRTLTSAVARLICQSEDPSPLPTGIVSLAASLPLHTSCPPLHPPSCSCLARGGRSALQ